jgi:6-pyruvoyltetrahydropterin/6-carboxytetrahydropterin synthase
MTLATISKEFTFSSSHQLDGLPEDHPCTRLHGHNYAVKLELHGSTDATGFVVDYRRLAPFKELLDGKLDHRHLNDVVPFNPTAEHLSFWLAEQAVAMLLDMRVTTVHRVTVAVSETPKTWATSSLPLHSERNL